MARKLLKAAKASTTAKHLQIENQEVIVKYAECDAKGNVINETYRTKNLFRKWDETEAHLRLLDSPDSTCPDIVTYNGTRWDLAMIEDGSFKYIDYQGNEFAHTVYSNPIFTETTGGVTIANPNSINMTANLTNFVTESVELEANQGNTKRISKGYTAGKYTINCQLLSVSGKGWSDNAEYSFEVSQLIKPEITDSQVKIQITNPNNVDVDCYYSNYKEGTISIEAGKTITIDKDNVLGTFTIDAYLRCEGYSNSDITSYEFNVERYTLAVPQISIGEDTILSIYNPNDVDTTAIVTVGSSSKEVSVPATTTTTTTLTASEIATTTTTTVTVKLTATDWNDSNEVSDTVSIIVYGISGVGKSSHTLTRTDSNSGLSYSSAVLKSFFVANEDVTDSKSNHFVKLKKFYVRMTQNSDGSLNYQVSKAKIKDAFLCPYFYDKDGNEIDYAYYGKYKGNVSSSRLRSVSGVTPTYSTNIDNFRTYARANGTNNYHQTDWPAVFLAQVMFMIVYADTKIDSYFSYRTYGSTTGSGTKFYGIEDMIGNGYEDVDGYQLYSKNTIIWYNYVGQYSSSQASNYQSVSLPSNGFQITHQYVSGKPAVSLLPKTAGGSSSTYYCDYFFSSSYSPSLCCWGAGGSDDIYGLFYLYMNVSWTFSFDNFGGRLHTKILG